VQKKWTDYYEQAIEIGI